MRAGFVCIKQTNRAAVGAYKLGGDGKAKPGAAAAG